jgi:hypothetical protein
MSKAHLVVLALDWKSRAPLIVQVDAEVLRINMRRLLRDVASVLQDSKVSQLKDLRPMMLMRLKLSRLWRRCHSITTKLLVPKLFVTSSYLVS